MCPVKVGEKWGFIDETGKMVIAPKFDGAFAFSERLARAENGQQYFFIGIYQQSR
jgi:hypothetical protein